MYTTAYRPTQDFLITDLSDSHYDKLIIFKHCVCQIGDIENYMPYCFTGSILIDMMAKMGAKNNDRFLTCRVINGKLEDGSWAFVKLSRKDDLRVLSNRTLVQHCPDSLVGSVLTQVQRKMLIKGLSI
ncbi:hypothetical protein [Paenibacillus gallinarum]|uniref:Uncharacterized protein n=1 Tax=Paenibacillus gallinarum TaxID=2762232 RepID=A0ABR8T3X4_9BACL|nr:hypothetical protein [Paenibacillus gallinarum]MBD7970243.1 hypothetical protein [Paenibacillus gallinarum]